MITLPTQAITAAWHQQLAWRNFVTNTFRLISRRRDFTTEYRTQGLIAGVIPDQRRLLLNPALVPIPDARLRFDPRTEHDRRVRLLRAITAHEAGHVVFSARKPTEQTLGWLWNALEDERMERLVMRRFPELAPDLTFLGDAMYLNAPRPTYDLLNACLVWRWAHDCPVHAFQVTPEHQDLWETRIRPLVEEAWDAHRDDVAVIAQDILDLLPPKAEQAPQEQDLSADGGGMSEAQPEEGTPNRDRDGTPQPGDSEGDDTAADPSDNATDPSADPSAPDPTSSEDADGQGRGKPSPSPDDSGQDGQAGTGGEASDLPLPVPPPAPLEVPDDELLRRTEGYARQLAGILAPPGTPAGRTSHRSRGRFEYGRYQQGAERYFQRKTRPDKPAPFQLRLCVDLSTSMSGPRMTAAREASLMLARAALLARSRLAVMGFTNDAHQVVPLDTPWEETTRRLYGMQASGTTLLGPALHHTLALPHRPDERVVILIITDGELLAHDARHCEYLLNPPARGRRLTPAPEIVPILIGEAGESAATFLEVFGAAHPVLALEDVTRAIRSALTTLRAR